MKKYLFITIVSLLLGNQMAKAQLFEYKKEAIDNRQFEDVCIEYVRDVFNVGNKQITILGMTHYPLSNGNTFVFLRFKWIGMTYYEEHQVPGSLVWSSNKTETIYQSHQIEEARRCGIVVNPNGFVNSWFVIPDNFSIWKLTDDILCFLVDKSVNTLNMTIYNSFKCLDSNGNLVWEPKNDFMAFDLLKTYNNLYIAGEKVGNEVRSLIRVYDIKTGKVINEKIGNNRGICFGLKYGEDGIDYTEYLESNNTRKQLNIPVEANDIAAHRRKIMSSYNQNNASDQVAIGERYLIGKGFEKDEKKAFEWFQKAAGQNNNSGIERIAYCYQNGLGVSQDKSKAVSYYEEAAKAGNNDAIAAVTKMYVDGDGIPHNMSRAYYWQEVLAFKGDKEAQRYVILNQNNDYEKADISSETVHQLGKEAHNAKDYDWARFCFERGMSLGNKKSQYNLGFMNMFAEGVEQNFVKAIEYWQELAEQGDAHAQFGLGNIYGLGDMKHGLSPDEKKEAYWYGKAAENGDANAQYTMGQFYENGHGVKKNKKAAAAMYEKSALSGNQEAIKKTVYNYETGYGVKKDESQCLMWFKKLNLENQLEVAEDFDENPKIKCTVGIVINMYENIAKQNHYGAMKKFAELSVEYRAFNNAVDAINLLERANNISYSTRNADSYMLFGKLYEREGRIGQAIECYRNSGTQEGREKAEMLNRRR